MTGSVTPHGSPAFGAVQIGQVLVAAARLLKVDPAAVYQTEGRRARILAAAALRSRTSCRATVLAPFFKICAPELAPSMLIRAGITTDQMLSVLDGVDFPGHAGAMPSQAAPPAAEQGAAEPVAKAEVVPPRAKAPPVASAVSGADYLTDSRRLRKASAPRAVVHPKPRPGEVPERPLPAPRFPSEQPRPSPPPQRVVMTRVKAVSADIPRWAGWFLAADWDLEDVAELFEVDSDSLADRLEGVAA